ncbi:hypothetical protein PTTG_26357, partial [Puccinia triticina 1-1 BBBD Race 1]
RSTLPIKLTCVITIVCQAYCQLSHSPDLAPDRSSASSLISKTKARSMYHDLDVFVALNFNSLLSLDVMLGQEAQAQHTFSRRPASESVDLCNVIILMKPFAYSLPAVSLSMAPSTTTAGPTIPPSSPGPLPRPIPMNLPSLQ